MTTTTSAITDNVARFVVVQNENRGGALAGGGTLPLDYSALTGTAPAGSNTVTGIDTINATSTAIVFPTAPGNALVINGANAYGSDGGNGLWDAYEFSYENGVVTLVDQNTGYSETVTGASYLLFDGASVNSASGAYYSIFMIESGLNYDIAAMYNAAFQRQPDLAGLEYYTIPVASGAMSLHQAAVYFLASPEFARDYPALTAPADNGGPNDTAFITELYGNILHRTPSVSEVAYYVDALQGTLTTSTGAAIPAADRADLLIYFSISPENQQDVSGWLINGGGAYQQAGATLSPQTILTSEATSGTINAADFASVATGSTIYTVTNSTGGIEVIGSGSTVGGLAVAGAAISVSESGVTVNLSSAINLAYVSGQGDVVNGAAAGGSTIYVSSGSPGLDINNLVTANLSGNGNTIIAGYAVNTNVTTASIINGWNSTDVIKVGSGAVTVPLETLGVLANTSAASVVAAAGVSATANQNGWIAAQDGTGDTYLYHWHSSSAGPVTVAGIDGAVELVGVQASALTSANFH